MPTVKDVAASVDDIARAIAALPGVTGVHIHGSYLTYADQPNYPLKDIDIIACTKFDSGDLMAIDAGRDSPLKIAATEWEDYGFHPEAVLFTKQFLGMRQHNLDHWATSSDGKLLHWGPMPESIDEWQEVHAEAEKFAEKTTGYNRKKLTKSDDAVKTQWRDAYLGAANRGISKRDRLLGWLPSEHSAEEVLANARKLL